MHVNRLAAAYLEYFESRFFPIDDTVANAPKGKRGIDSRMIAITVLPLFSFGWDHRSVIQGIPMLLTLLNGL